MNLTNLNPESVNLDGYMEEETPEGLKDDKKQLSYECIISSFKKEQPLSELNKDSSNYDFKFKNWLK